MKDKEHWVEFEVGTKQITEGRLRTIAAIIYATVDILSRLTGISERKYWAVVDSFGRKFRVNAINQIILKSPELLTERINKDLDEAIIEYNGQVEKDTPQPVMIDEAEGETDLGGTLGFTYDFVVDLTEDKEEN